MDERKFNGAVVLGILLFTAVCAWGVALGSLYRIYVG